MKLPPELADRATAPTLGGRIATKFVYLAILVLLLSGVVLLLAQPSRHPNAETGTVCPVMVMGYHGAGGGLRYVTNTECVLYWGLAGPEYLFVFAIGVGLLIMEFTRWRKGETLDGQLLWTGVLFFGVMCWVLSVPLVFLLAHLWP